MTITIDPTEFPASYIEALLAPPPGFGHLNVVEEK